MSVSPRYVYRMCNDREKSEFIKVDGQLLEVRPSFGGLVLKDNCGYCFAIVTRTGKVVRNTLLFDRSHADPIWEAGTAQKVIAYLEKQA